MPIRQVDIDDLGKDKDDPKAKPESKAERDRKERTDKSLNARLQGCFDRIAEALVQRGDEELAEIVREDAEVMAGGLMSLTRPFKPLRGIVVLFVSVIEPALAFGRILRVLVSRWAERRAAAAAQAEYEGAGQPAASEPFPPHEDDPRQTGI